MPTLTEKRWKLKGCPRCGGDLYLADQQRGKGIFYSRWREWGCLQCGFNEEEITEVAEYKT